MKTARSQSLARRGCLQKKVPDEIRQTPKLRNETGAPEKKNRDASLSMMPRL